MNDKMTHLKCITNGRVLMRSDTLAARDDMIACDAEGNIAEGHTGESAALDAMNDRRKTKYLGNVTNGVLYPFTNFLAQRDDMVSIDTPEQWEIMRKTGEAPKQDPAAISPALTRSPKVPVVEPDKNPAPVANIQTAIDSQVPNIENMGAREAKNVLSKWAIDNYQIKIDRRPAIKSVLEACNELAATRKSKAVG